MNRFRLTVIDDKLILAATKASQLLRPDGAFMNELRNKNDWKYNSGNGELVFQKLTKETAPLEVSTYKPFWRWSSAIGYFDGKKMFINEYKLPMMTVDDVVANLCHEFAHKQGFSHGNNYKNSDKVKYSVPYYLSEQAAYYL